MAQITSKVSISVYHFLLQLLSEKDCQEKDGFFLFHVLQEDSDILPSREHAFKALLQSI